MKLLKEIFKKIIYNYKNNNHNIYNNNNNNNYSRV